jgi:hypothetical protein
MPSPSWRESCDALASSSLAPGPVFGRPSVVARSGDRCWPFGRELLTARAGRPELVRVRV